MYLDEDDQSPQLEPSGTSSNASHLSLVKWLIIFLFLLQAKFHLSDKVLDIKLYLTNATLYQL